MPQPKAADPMVAAWGWGETTPLLPRNGSGIPHPVHCKRTVLSATQEWLKVKRDTVEIHTLIWSC